MSSLNQVNLIGNLGCDPQVLKSNEKGDFVKLSLATTKRYRIKEGKVEEDTQWHTVYASNGLGKIVATHLKKGARIFVTGELRTHEWQDKSGKTHSTIAIYAKDVKFLSVKSSEKKEPDFSLETSEESSAYDQAMDQIREALGNHFNTNN